MPDSTNLADELNRKDPLRFIKWATAVACLIWIVMFGWSELWQRYENTGYFGPGELFFQRYDQRIIDCRGDFQERYDCKSDQVREKYVNLFYYWAERVIIVFGPTIGFGLIWLWFYLFVEKKREAGRRVRRLARRAEEEKELRQQATDAARLQTQESRQQKKTETMSAQASMDMSDDEESKLMGTHILLIEEDEDAVLVISRALQNIGGTVTASFKFEDGLERFESGSFDIVVMSISMADTRGLEAIAKIRTIQPDAKIIVLAAEVNGVSPDAVEAGASQIGADVLLPNPVDGAALGEAVSRVAG